MRLTDNLTTVDVNVDEVMREIEDEVRRARRKRLLAQGGAPEYQDPRLYAMVDSLLRRAVEGRDHDSLLLSDLAAGEDSERLTTHLRFQSHRPVLGRAVLFAKQRVLLPAMRWLYEYSLNNFRRQDRLNRVLFACVEELAIENASLRLELQKLQELQERPRSQHGSGWQEGAGRAGLQRVDERQAGPKAEEPERSS